MDISKKVYAELSTRERAIAIFSAVNRLDGAEAERLTRHAPRGEGHGQAVLGLRQALDVYNNFMAHLIKNFLYVNGEAKAVQEFCRGWLSAEGSSENVKYKENSIKAEKLSQASERLVDEIESFQQAAREWCEKNEIPVNFFSGPLCHIELQKATGQKFDDKALKEMRSVFDKIEMSW